MSKDPWDFRGFLRFFFLFFHQAAACTLLGAGFSCCCCWLGPPDPHGKRMTDLSLISIFKKWQKNYRVTNYFNKVPDSQKIYRLMTVAFRSDRFVESVIGEWQLAALLAALLLESLLHLTWTGGPNIKLYFKLKTITRQFRFEVPLVQMGYIFINQITKIIKKCFALLHFSALKFVPILSPPTIEMPVATWLFFECLK